MNNTVNSSGLLVEVAKHLTKATGTKWHAPDDDSLVSADGLTIWTRVGGYGNVGRRSLSYSRPRDGFGSYVEVYENHNRLSDPRITVSDEADARRVASEIVRRLLPESVKVHQLVLDAIQVRQKYENDKKSLAEQVGALVGQTVKVEAGSTVQIDPFRSIRWQDSNYRMGYGHINVNSTNIDFELRSVPATLGLRIAAAISNILKEEADRVAALEAKNGC